MSDVAKGVALLVGGLVVIIAIGVGVSAVIMNAGQFLPKGVGDSIGWVLVGGAIILFVGLRVWARRQ